jgi:hypothetical protein
MGNFFKGFIVVGAPERKKRGEVLPPWLSDRKIVPQHFLGLKDYKAGRWWGVTKIKTLKGVSYGLGY